MEDNKSITKEKLLELVDKVEAAENKPFVYVGTKKMLKLWSKLVHDDSIKLLELGGEYPEDEIHGFKSWRDYVDVEDIVAESEKRKEEK